MGNTIKFKAVCARGVGRSHASTQTPCQDYTSILRDTPKGLISVSLSDGAGSCSLSHIGSRIITKETNRYLVQHFHSLTDDNIELHKSNLLNQIKCKLAQRAVKDMECSIKPYSGTLLAVVTNGEKFIVLHLGDGVIGFMQDDQPLVLSMPSNGEYSNTTYFVTDKDALSNLRAYTGHIQTISSFILMSDGTQESLYDKKNGSLASAYLKLAEWLNQYSEKKVSKILSNNIKEVFTKKSSDDCSIAILNIIRLDNGQ